jgi:hypothetical protein
MSISVCIHYSYIATANRICHDADDDYGIYDLIFVVGPSCLEVRQTTGHGHGEIYQLFS